MNPRTTSLSEFFAHLRNEGAPVYYRALRALCKNRPPTHTEKGLAWAAWEEWAEGELRRFDYWNHPEIA